MHDDICRLPEFTSTEQLQQLIDWKMGSPRHRRRFYKASTINAAGGHMQRQFTIECRVDYADNEKNEAMRKAMCLAAAHINATAELLADGVRPQTVAFSDDWMSGYEEIRWLEDVIGNGRTTLDVNGEAGQDTHVSSELLAAVSEQAEDNKTRE